MMERGREGKGKEWIKRGKNERGDEAEAKGMKLRETGEGIY